MRMWMSVRASSSKRHRSEDCRGRHRDDPQVAPCSAFLRDTRMEMAGSDEGVETGLVHELLGFFGDRIFGPNRRELLELDLRALEGKADRQHRSRIPSLRRAIELIEARRARQVRNLEVDDDPDGLMFRRIRDRLEELEQDRLAKLEELRRLEEEEEDTGREAQAVELLEALPLLPEGLSSAPEVSACDGCSSASG